jgi:hypothetical protein
MNWQDEFDQFVQASAKALAIVGRTYREAFERIGRDINASPAAKQAFLAPAGDKG